MTTEIDTTDIKNGTPLWKYDRLCGRTDEVLDRYKLAYPQLAAFEPTLRPPTQRYREQYGALDLGEREARLLTKTARAEVKLLEVFMRSWAPTLGHLLGDNDIAPLMRPRVPDDTITEGRRLLERLTVAESDGRPSLDNAQALIDRLLPLVERAASAWSAAQDALARLQRRRAELRQTASQLNATLIAFRRALRAQLGAKHRDYQKLRPRRLRKQDVEDLPEPAPSDARPADEPAA